MSRGEQPEMAWYVSQGAVGEFQLRQLLLRSQIPELKLLPFGKVLFGPYEDKQSAETEVVLLRAQHKKGIAWHNDIEVL